MSVFLPPPPPTPLTPFSATGQIFPSLPNVLFQDSWFVRRALLDRMRGSQGSVALGPGSNILPYAPEERPGFPIKAPPAPPRGPDITLWTQAFGVWGKIDGDANAAAVKHRLGGFLSGFDARFGEMWQTGIAAGYSRAYASLVGDPATADIASLHVAAYAAFSLGAFTLRSGASYAWHRIDTERTVELPGFFDQPIARYNGGTVQAFSEAAYAMPVGRAVVEPFAALNFVNIRTDAFVETGGTAAVSGSATSQSIGFTSLGVRLSTSFTVQDGLTLAPRVSAAWQHAFGELSVSQQLAFNNGAASFSVQGVPIDRETLALEAGFDAIVGTHAVIGIAYIGALSANAQTHGAKGIFTWTF